MIINLIVIDDIDLSGEPWVISVQEAYPLMKINFYVDPEKAIKHLNERLSLGQFVIVLLDLDFYEKPSGVKILQEIRKITHIVPVIIFSGIDESLEQVSDLINLDAKAFIRKTDPEKIVVTLSDIMSHINTDIASALEEWIEANPESLRGAPYLTISDGKSYTLNDILAEIRQDTSDGRKFLQRLMKLTVDLVARNKEVLQ
jgi:DNA-binding NarL/FixJ family response regulator